MDLNLQTSKLIPITLIYNDLQDFNANLMETETNITASYSMGMEIKYNNLVRRLLI